MKATITVEMDNAAFEDQPQEELARILAEMVKRLTTDILFHNTRYSARDYNGNAVATLIIED